MENNYVIFDSRFVDSKQPIASAESRGLKYGEGVFETIRVYSGKTLFLQMHLDRLEFGLSKLGISGAITLDEIRPLISDLLNKKDLANSDAIVRLQVWREGERGYHTNGEGQSHFMITASQCPQRFQSPSLVTVDRRRIPSEALPSNCKFTNSINYILAAREASSNGGDDALMQTVEGWISETTIANVFWVKSNSVFTPSKKCDLIPGITRQIIITIVQNHPQWEIKEGQFSLDDLEGADTFFMSNSVRQVLPIAELNGKPFNTDHPFLSELKRLFDQFRTRNLKPLVR